ncbi:alpha/beta fold hydrolase [Micromonospora polyrhachis]|uniref:Medium-chain acyl-[acyl-carrier-protein] hydrolase n=1 Tax=Micromonospora polyrhachis TaxID=1282883 RepID=A0A7W7SZR0_9ACTN|nr:alpha/beta fold hydrolase [Micromonospora polyrhachis]MBB4962610.1 medium-chain acyl-[acyl-carrier-protein] hydrolase [Micromonospora polyrhachis]
MTERSEGISPWFCGTTRVDASTRLFCFPYAGGNAAAFLPWQPLLGPDVELWVAQLPGRGTRLFETPLPDLDELVARLADVVGEHTDRPYVLFGHSLGALVAFEVARALRRAGLPPPCGLWVAGAEGPQTRVIDQRLHNLPDAELVNALRDYGGTSTELLDDPEMMALLLPGLRADLAVDECYDYRTEPRLELPIHLLLGSRDPHVDRERAEGWSRESNQRIHRHVFPGEHFFLFPHQATITALLATALATNSMTSR